MTAMLAVGAGEGALLAVLIWLLVPHRTSLATQLSRFENRPVRSPDRTPPAGQAEDDPLTRLQRRLGEKLSTWLALRGITYGGLRQDLALNADTFETILARKAAGFVLGFLLAIASTISVRAVHLRTPAFAPAAVAVGLGTALFFVPDLRARRIAHARRREFRRALGSWLDLVALEMAGSAAPAEALPAAARIGGEWPMIVIRETLYRATVSGQDHWEALTDLGDRLGVHELTDLAALTRSVGRDGAQVRETLTARASALRRALLAESQAQAGRQDQSMLVAHVLIGMGFVVFVMYPAIVNVMSI